MSRLRLWSIVALLGASAAGFAALPFHALDATGGRLERPRPGEARPAIEIYVEEGKRYPVYEDIQERPWHRGMQIRAVGHGSGDSLGFLACAGPATATDACPQQRSPVARNVPDRIELVVDGNKTGPDAEEIKLDVARYLAFDLMLGADTEAPLNWTLVQQVYQRVPGNAPPPFAIYLRRDPDAPKRDGEDLRRVPLELVLAVRDDDDIDCSGFERCGAFLRGTPIPVRRGQWMRMVMLLRPSAQPAIGRVDLWKDHACVGPRSPPDASFRGPWGYSPRARASGAAEPASDQFDVRLGIYRRQQPRQLSVYFDQIRFGRALADVTRAC